MPVSNSISKTGESRPADSPAKNDEKGDTNSSPETNTQDEFSTNENIARHRALHLIAIYFPCHSLS